MRFFFLLLLLGVRLSEGSRGYSLRLTPGAFSVSKNNEDFFQKASAPTTTGHNKAFAEIVADRSEPQKRRNILPRFLKIPLCISWSLGKATLKGFCWGYLAGTVYGLWGLVKDALAGENGIREVHDRSLIWGKNYAKFCAVFTAIIYGLSFAISSRPYSKMVDDMVATGAIDYSTYHKYQQVKGAFYRKMGIND